MSPSTRRLAVVASAALLAAPLARLEGAEPDLARICTRRGDDTTAVLEALHGAQRKLRAPACEALLDEFRGPDGRLLRERLAPFEMPAADYVTLLVILDGGDARAGRRCQGGDAAAVTTRGRALVYVCGEVFRSLSPGQRENVLIHEMLHALGLGENPPRPGEINVQVWRRCGG